MVDRMKSIVTIASVVLMILYLTSCSKDPINFESEMVQRNNTYYLKGQSDPYTGPIFSSYSNNNLRSNGDVIDGKKDGSWHEWYENGTIKSKENYKYGMAMGIWELWYENDQIKLKASFKNGKANGARTEWYENGQKKEEGNFINGEQQGRWTYYNKDGSLDGIEDY